MSNSAGDREAFRWTEEAGMAGLGDLPGDPFFSRALAVSADGSIVVGESNGYYWDFSSKAFIWDAENGMRALQEVLITDFKLGPSLEGWTLQGASAISADGRVIVGSGTNPDGQTEAWRAVLSEHPLVTIASGDFNAVATWDRGLTPNEDYDTVIKDHTATVDADAAALSISIEDGGAVVIDAGNVLTVARDVRVADGTLQIAPAGTLHVSGDFELADNAAYLSEFDGPANGLIIAGEDVELRGTLQLRAVGSLDAVGDTQRTIISADGEGSIVAGFAAEPAAGDHLGRGVFLRGVTGGVDGVGVALFQAAAGDTDGNREVDNVDLQRILAANSFHNGLGFDWPNGDFDGDTDVDNTDLQLILAAGLFGTGPYPAVTFAAADGAVDLALVPEPCTLVGLLSMGVVVLLCCRTKASGTFSIPQRKRS